MEPIPSFSLCMSSSRQPLCSLRLRKCELFQRPAKNDPLSWFPLTARAASVLRSFSCWVFPMWRGNFSHRWEDVCAFYYVPAPALSAFDATTAKRFSRERSPSRLGRVQSNPHSLRSVKPPGTASSCTVEQMPWQNKLPTCCEGCQSRIDGSGLFSASLQVLQSTLLNYSNY